MILLFLIFNGLTSGTVVGDTDVFGKLFGRGVCSIRGEDTKEVLTMQIHEYQEMGYSLCWHFPPWCKIPTGRELLESVTVPENIKHEILSLKCCRGYYPDKDNSFCIPICSEFCLPEKCFNPNDCSECQTGYHGPTCAKDDTPTNVTTTSAPSPHHCECPNENYRCNSEGKCVCLEGFDGPSCQHIIPAPRVVVDSDDCWYYVQKVGLLVMGLAASAILVAVLMRKRVCWSNTFEPLDDRNVPDV